MGTLARVHNDIIVGLKNPEKAASTQLTRYAWCEYRSAVEIACPCHKAMLTRCNQCFKDPRHHSETMRRLEIEQIELGVCQTRCSLWKDSDRGSKLTL